MTSSRRTTRRRARVVVVAVAVGGAVHRARADPPETSCAACAGALVRHLNDARDVNARRDAGRRRQPGTRTRAMTHGFAGERETYEALETFARTIEWDWRSCAAVTRANADALENEIFANGAEADGVRAVMCATDDDDDESDSEL